MSIFAVRLSAWHLDLLVISFSVINYVVSMRGPHVSGDNLFFYVYPSHAMR